MNNDYSRRDYALDNPDSVQCNSITQAVDLRAIGKEWGIHELNWDEDEPPGHDSDEDAIDGYCGGSRDTREPRDKADELAAKFEGY